MYFEYFLKTISKFLYSTTRSLNLDLLTTHCYRFDENIKDDRLVEHITKNDLIKNFTDSIPMVFCINEKLVYNLIKYPEGFFLVGPMNYIEGSALKNRIELEDDSLISGIDAPLFNADFLAEATLILANLYRKGDADEPYINDWDIFKANFTVHDEKESLSLLYNNVFENVEEGHIHNPYSHEKRQVESIKTGDVDSLKEILKERFPGRYGKLSSDPLRQEKNIGIVETTLASRAAIEGGLHPEVAFHLSDITIQKLEASRDPVNAMNISVDSQLHYAKLVREIKSETRQNENRANLHISHCKDYVFAHLHDKISVKEIANAVALDENYLSALFKKNEGISLKEYIQKEKINLAKNLLSYSSYSYIEIATYLGFSSQSHFGKVFKDITGMTPRKYRDNFIKEDFINETIQDLPL
ncbi:MAG: helix-turn-helix domain-containing protein [Lachnospiraceae bacterium]|nr:helix-turn-helix domain-containing protein [Lachnospiraceae bacterium]